MAGATAAAPSSSCPAIRRSTCCTRLTASAPVALRGCPASRWPTSLIISDSTSTARSTRSTSVSPTWMRPERARSSRFSTLWATRSTDTMPSADALPFTVWKGRKMSFSRFVSSGRSSSSSSFCSMVPRWSSASATNRLASSESDWTTASSVSSSTMKSSTAATAAAGSAMTGMTGTSATIGSSNIGAGGCTGALALTFAATRALGFGFAADDAFAFLGDVFAFVAAAGRRVLPEDFRVVTMSLVSEGRCLRNRRRCPCSLRTGSPRQASGSP